MIKIYYDSSVEREKSRAHNLAQALTDIGNTFSHSLSGEPTHYLVKDGYESEKLIYFPKVGEYINGNEVVEYIDDTVIININNYSYQYKTQYILPNNYVHKYPIGDAVLYKGIPVTIKSVQGHRTYKVSSTEQEWDSIEEGKLTPYTTIPKGNSNGKNLIEELNLTYNNNNMNIDKLKSLQVENYLGNRKNQILVLKLIKKLKNNQEKLNRLSFLLRKVSEDNEYALQYLYKCINSNNIKYIEDQIEASQVIIDETEILLEQKLNEVLYNNRKEKERETKRLSINL